MCVHGLFSTKMENLCLYLAGDILNRFSRDTGFMDQLLPRNLTQLLSVSVTQYCQLT